MSFGDDTLDPSNRPLEDTSRDDLDRMGQLLKRATDAETKVERLNKKIITAHKNKRIEQQKVKADKEEQRQQLRIVVEQRKAAEAEIELLRIANSGNREDAERVERGLRDREHELRERVRELESLVLKEAVTKRSVISDTDRKMFTSWRMALQKVCHMLKVDVIAGHDITTAALDGVQKVAERVAELEGTMATAEHERQQWQKHSIKMGDKWDAADERAKDAEARAIAAEADRNRLDSQLVEQRALLIRVEKAEARATAAEAKLVVERACSLANAAELLKADGTIRELRARVAKLCESDIDCQECLAGGGRSQKRAAIVEAELEGLTEGEK